MTISGIINTYREASNIRFAVASLTTWCDEVIVMDQESPDGTAEIAREAGATVFSHPYTGYVEAARAAAVDAARGDWLMILDADELVHPGLGPVLRAIAERDDTDVVLIPRRNIILGRWMRHGQWWPNRKARFARRGALEISPEIHAGLKRRPDARVMALPAREDRAIWHFSYHDLEDLVEKTNRYTSIEARQRSERRPRRITPGLMLSVSARRLWREYVRDGGFRDGTAGLAVAVTRAYYRFLAMAKMWDLDAASRRDADYARAKAALLAAAHEVPRPAPSPADDRRVAV